MTLEVAVAYLITAQLATYFLDLDYHPQTRNCPMDFTGGHSELVGGLRKGRFCRQCSTRLDKSVLLPRRSEQ